MATKKKPVSNADKIREGLRQAVKAAKDEFNKQVDAAAEKVNSIVDTVGNDDDVKDIVAGYRGLIRRAAEKVAKKFSDDPPSKPKS